MTYMVWLNRPITHRFLAILLWAICLPCHSERADYGNSAYPIWSPLSYFERQSIGDISRAANGKPDALLALYLVASGVRESSEYVNAYKRLNRFQQDLEKLIVDDPDPWLTGKLINSEMHKTFFLKPTEQHASGYAVAQSRLMGVFENGEFNCISSALLYAVLARLFDLPAKGVLLPSHAFIELNLADGRNVDVETTSPSGFDQHHDQAFYEKANQTWFADRNLTPTTYNDYRHRERISLLSLAARNMLNQHTTEAAMAREDGFRLAEISAFIDPTYALAQEKRLYFYNSEIHTLILQQDWVSLKRLFAVTYETVLRDSARHQQSSKVQTAMQMYLSGALLAYAQMGNTEATLEVMGELLKRDWNLAESRAELEQRVTNALGVLLQHLVDQKQFDDGLLLLSLTEAHLTNQQAWADMNHWLYFRWAEDHWQHQRWEDAIFTLKDFQDLSNGDDQKHTAELIESAYYNWVLELINAKDHDTAIGVVEQCRIQINQQQLCRKAEKLLQSSVRDIDR